MTPGIPGAGAASQPDSVKGEGAGAPSSPAGPSAESVRAALQKILASEGFANSERLSRLLCFVVERALEGRAEEIKEYLLAVEVFGRRPSYDPHIDSIVRVEAARLRTKLREYYETEGRRDPLRIELPRRSYVPVFEQRRGVARLREWVVFPGGWRTAVLAAAVVLAAIATVWAVALARRNAALRKELEVRSAARNPAARAGNEFSSIVVLPFVNLSSDKENEYFSDGLTEELINALTKIDGLHVVSRTSAFQFKGKVQDIRNIGKHLNVGAALEGSVRKVGRKLRVTAQLIDVQAGYHLWSGTYERDTQDVFAIQDEISRAIVDALRLRLGSGQTIPLVRRYTENLDAYNLYLKGRYYASKRTEAGLRKGIQYFEQAIAKDPNYALAYADLAECYDYLRAYGPSSNREVMAKSKAAVLKALEIDDTLAEAHTQLGAIKAFYEYKWREAEGDFTRALELNPASPGARYRYAMYLMVLGRLEQARAELQRGQQLDPLSLAIGGTLAATYFLQREYDKAIEQCLRTLELDPSFHVAYWMLGRAYEEKSMYPEAIAAFQKARELSGGGPRLLGSLGHAYAVSGRRSEALKLIEELKSPSGERTIVPYDIAVIYAGLGEKDQAFEWLERTYRERYGRLGFLKVEPVFDPLRSDGRFAALLEKIGLSH